jgi:signal transduction histidine kinase
MSKHTNWEKLSQVINHLNHSLVYLNPQGKVETFNEQAPRVFGWDRSVGSENYIIEFYEKIDKPLPKDNQPHLLARKNRNIKGFHTNLRANDQLIEVLVDAIPIVHSEVSRDANDDSSKESEVRDDQRAVLLCIQILEKQSVQPAVDQLQALVSTARMSALGDLAAGLSHEINNPLAILKGRVEQLKKNAENKEQNPSYTADVLDKMDRAIARIARIVKNMQILSRPDVEELAENINLSEVVRESFGFLRESFLREGIDVQFKSSSQVQAFARPATVSQVLLTLLSNARDAIVLGKSYSERQNSWVRISVGNDGGKAWFSVEDSGPGIPEDIRDKIMQPFFTTKDAGKGTGLGLSMALGLMRSMQGNLRLDSSSKHTKFIAEMPEFNGSSGKRSA